MPKIDVTDEAIIDSPPIEVYKAILNELSGFTKWWMPHIEFKPRSTIDREGAVFEATIKPQSRMSAKCSAKITKLATAKSIELEYTGGDFLGTGVYTFEPKDGKTKLKYRFNVRTNRLLASLLSPFINLSKAHSEVMQKGFQACNNYLRQES
jgi:uncharacterized protein YndB with AHSA1/START domain